MTAAIKDEKSSLNRGPASDPRGRLFLALASTDPDGTVVIDFPDSLFRKGEGRVRLATGEELHRDSLLRRVHPEAKR
jgi:hypothetical protein